VAKLIDGRGGIAKAKAAGVYKGRKPSVDVSQMRALKQKGVGPSATDDIFSALWARRSNNRAGDHSN
jgi:hypothetical protein